MAGKKGQTAEIAAADQLIDIVKETMNFFHAQDGRPFVAVVRNGRNEIYEINTEKFRLLLSRTFFKEAKKTIAQGSLDTAIRHLAAISVLDGPMMEVYNRIAPCCNGGVAIDLADPTWRAVVVTPAGWEVRGDAALFVRDRAQVSLPEPEAGGSIDELRGFIPLNDADWRLLVVWIVKAFTPNGPYPLLELTGRQGSAKSVRTRLLVALIDPHLGDLQSLPKDERDLLISALHTHLLAFDNVSRLPSDKSDCFCRLATGGGFRIRRLYSDTEETIIDACKPVIINGINRICLQQDLIDRAVQITVPTISPEQRLSEEEVLNNFEAARPRILGAFMTLLSKVLNEVKNVSLSSMPRMADFARLGVTVERVLGWPEGSFLDAYAQNNRSSLEASVEGDPVGQAIVRLMNTQISWKGTASDLLAALAPLVPSQEIRGKSWPKTGNWLSQRLDRLAPGLEAMGITMARLDYDAGIRKVITLCRVDDIGGATQIASVVADAIPSNENPVIATDSGTSLAMCGNSDISLGLEEFSLDHYRTEN